MVARVLRAQPAASEVKLSYATITDLVDAVFDETRARPAARAGIALWLLRSCDRRRTSPHSPARRRPRSWVSWRRCPRIDRSSSLSTTCSGSIPASGTAIAFVARRLPDRCGLLLARRGDPGGRSAIRPRSGVARGRNSSGLPPGTFSPAALHHLIAGRFGSAPPRPVLSRIAEACGGNPYFALEIARALGGEWRDLSPGEPLPVPRDLEELVRERISGLSEAARLAALACAALSRPTPGMVARAVPGKGAGRRGLLEAEEAGVLDVGSERVHFTHPLLAAAIYGIGNVGTTPSTARDLGRGRQRSRGACTPPRPLHDRARRGRRFRARAGRGAGGEPRRTSGRRRASTKVRAG